MRDEWYSMDSRTPLHLAKQPSFLADTSLSPHTESSAPATPLSSKKHKGPHRDGFSVKKCRDVLVRQCSWIPRNYNFKDGVNQVYEVLREYLGDENLDLAIAQLDELIEIPSEWPHDEGASFQAWKHDYMLRHKDLENSHVPRLRNIIVAPINPTERLKKWREDHLDWEHAIPSSSQSSQTPSSNNEIQTITPDYGIGTGARGGDWRLENAVFVSSKTQGTRVLHCPSAQELHKKIWNEGFGRGGRLVQERIITPGEPVDGVNHLPETISPLKGKKSSADSRSMRLFVDLPVINRIRPMGFVPENLNTSLHLEPAPHGRRCYSKQASCKGKFQAQMRYDYPDSALGRFSSDVKTYEGDPAVRELPDPDSDIGKSYYSNIPTWPLPLGISVPNPRFARKHDLVPEEVSLPGEVLIKLVPTADEMAIEKSFQDAARAQSSNNAIGLAGPFTPELFKDSGLDFPRYWDDAEHVPACGKFEIGALSDMGNLGDAAQSPSKILHSISKRIQAFSSVSVSPVSEPQRSLYSIDESSHHPLKGRKVGLTASTPKATDSNGLQWHNFTSKRNGTGGAKSNTAPVTVSLHESHLVLPHPLTELTKAIKQALSESFHSEQRATSTSASFSLAHHSLDAQSSPVSYRSGNAVVTETHCAIMEHVNPTSSSTIIVNGSYNSADNGIEADKQNELSLQNKVPEITVEPPPASSKCHPAQICNPGKFYASMRDKRQKSKIALLMTGNRHMVEAATNAATLITTEEFADWKPTMELALKMLRETGDLRLKTMLNCPSPGANDLRVQNNNNNNGNADALSKREYSNVKDLNTNSLERFPNISLALVQRSEELTKRWLDHQIASEMDLNRDLPPLPPATDPRSLKISEPAAEYTQELLQPLCYDPVRDSLRYGGVHYHPDGMRYYAEVLQHPIRTSSMPGPGNSSDSPVRTINPQVEAGERLKPSTAAHASEQDVLGTIRTPDASYNSEASSGILGNFIPVKRVASPSVIVTRAVHVPRIETNCSMWMRDQNSKAYTTGKASSSVNTYSQKTPEKIDTSKVNESDRMNIKQGLGGSVLPNNDHDSIDLNDPEALTKYIRHLKKTKKHHLEKKKQSLALDSSLSQNLDGDAGKNSDKKMNSDTDDYTVIDSDENSEAPNFTAKDYSAIGAGNPFEFEPDDIQNDPDRVTTFTDFMGGMNNYEASSPHQSKKIGHFKNSHSESNALYMKKRPEPIQVDKHNASRHVLQRSGSSPNISPTRIAGRRGALQSSFQSSHNEDDRPYPRSVNRGHHVNSLSRSPTRGRDFSRSSPKQLDDVPESHKVNFETPPPSQKRPWSPVKKIFGEGGWLSSTASPKGELSTLKKPGLVEKIKLKIEEIGLKADLGPMKYPFKSEQGKVSEQSTFPISLNPAQQAEVYFDIELLICDSANTFLMHEYQNGRMSVDSLKKVIDFWKSKGRPQVVEFHYDQSTQRDLIVANQKTFRFYGPNSNNPLQVHAMLYAWKTDAREMAVRTFCYPDSMIRKHIQDTFMILDFLGGHPFQYIAAHEVHAKMSEWIKEAQAHMAARSLGSPTVHKVGRRSNESSLEVILENPWHNASKPTQRPRKQSSGLDEASPPINLH